MPTRVLEEVGIEFRDDAEALALWKKAGADVKGERVHFPKGLCRELLKTAPSVFTQHARNPERSVQIGGDATVFAPVYGPPFVRDLDGNRRYATIEDFRNFVKLAYMAPSIHHSGGTVCEPVDVPVNKRHLDMVLCAYPLFRQAVHGLGHRARARRGYGRDGQDPVRREVRRRKHGRHQPDQRQLADGLRRDHAGRRPRSMRAPTRRRSSRRSFWPAR